MVLWLVCTGWYLHKNRGGLVGGRCCVEDGGGGSFSLACMFFFAFSRGKREDDRVSMFWSFLLSNRRIERRGEKEAMEDEIQEVPVAFTERGARGNEKLHGKRRSEARSVRGPV